MAGGVLALLSLSACGTGPGGPSPAPSPPAPASAPAAPCATQPWSADEAPWQDEEFRARGVTPPRVLNMDEIQRSTAVAQRSLADLLRPGDREQAIHHVLVGPDGATLLVQLATSTGNAEVERIGRSIAGAKRFAPATRFGCGVVAWHTSTFRFFVAGGPASDQRPTTSNRTR